MYACFSSDTIAVKEHRVGSTRLCERNKILFGFVSRGYLYCELRNTVNTWAYYVCTSRCMRLSVVSTNWDQFLIKTSFVKILKWNTNVSAKIERTFSFFSFLYSTAIQGCSFGPISFFFFYWPLTPLSENTAACKARFACSRRRRGHRVVKEVKKVSLPAMCVWLAHLVAAPCRSICRTSCRPFFRGCTSSETPIPSF